MGIRITGYRFGSVSVDGAQHTSDVVVLPGAVRAGWRRAEGHRLVPADLEGIIPEGVSVLIVGTGAMGMMKVPEETVRRMGARGVEVRAMRTGRAVEEYNALEDKGSAAAALHLTC